MIYQDNEDRYLKEARKGGKALYFARSMSENVGTILLLDHFHNVMLIRVGDLGPFDRKSVCKAAWRLRSTRERAYKYAVSFPHFSMCASLIT